MKDYLMNISKELENFSLSLNKTSVLINKPWALLDEDNDIQKLIFKKNKDLVLSKNGKVQMGRWDYFPEAKSLLIDRNSDTILCNEVFINEGVMILKMDGAKNKYFTLSNENIVPDLDAIKYLKELRKKKLNNENIVSYLDPIKYLKELREKKFNIREYKLDDGRLMEIYFSFNCIEPSVGDKVVIQGVEKLNGLFKLAEPEKHLLIIQNTFSHIFTEKEYESINGRKLLIVQRSKDYFQLGDFVYEKGEFLQFDEIGLSKKIKLIINNGKITRIKRKYFNLFWL